jgi:hypothetical protein
MSEAFTQLVGSKKAIVTIAGMILVYAAHASNADPTGELSTQIAQLVSIYVGGQALVDGASKFKG